MKRTIEIIVAVAALVLAAALPVHGQNQSTRPSNAGPVAIGASTGALSLSKPVERVNGTVLTQRDLLREMYAIFPYAKQHNGFPKAMEADIRSGALQMITFEELVYQEAKRRGMTIAPERLAKAERQFREQFPSDQQYRDFLQSEADGSSQVMRNRIRRSLLIEDLLKAEVTSKSTATLTEAKSFYLKNPQRFQVPESYGLQTITIMPPKPADPKKEPVPPTPEQWKQMQARAQNALRQAQQAKTYEDFGLLAEKISEDDYRVMMGNHHPLPTAQVPAEILQVISKMQPGQISGIIQAEGALTIVRLNTHAPATMQKFPEVSEVLRTQLEKQKSEKLRHELNARLRKNAKIEQL
jgi:peptidyl-prolyl cis-trans isomerase SurA